MKLDEIKDLIKEAKGSDVTTLDLSFKRLTFLPSEISELKNLTQLNISGNQLTSLPSEVSMLKNLTQLNISGNLLTSFPSELSKLKNLTQLNISANRLTSLSLEISELKNLTQLNVSINQLTSLPPEISELKNLAQFNISANQLTSLPPEISKLKNLTQLNVSANQLTFLPSEISELKNLTQLYISGNLLTSLPPEISKLKNLTEIDISRNKLPFLSREVLELILELGLEICLDIRWGNRQNSNIIFVKENLFLPPPIEIARKGREDVINYFKALEDRGEPLNEVKVLLVGDGGAGKTSLVKRLLDEGFDGNEHQTQGINIKKWRFEDEGNEFKVNFWDFGGQEIMHATHQFFLSKRSLYILVVDSRKDEKAEYWLKHIRSFGGDSPVLIVLNKIDENPSFELNRKFLQEKYPSIKGFFRISCKEKMGVEDFSTQLKKELSKTEHMQIEWAKRWFKVKTRLEKMSCDFITYKEYQNMCLEENIDDKSSQDTLVDFLNDLGIIIHFKDISLFDTQVLEPRWITEGVYKIINSKTLAEKKGVLLFNMLDEILFQKKEGDYYYPPERYNFIINLMKKFELCYAINEETVLLPDLLEVSEPDFYFYYNDALKFFIEYDFLPRSVMPRFIVKMNKDIQNDLQWRTGVVLENKGYNSRAVIKSDNEAKRIYIYVNGGQKRDYFSSILFNLREINNSFEKLKAVEKIPIPNEPEISVRYLSNEPEISVRSLFDEPEISVRYDHLVTLEKMNIDSFVPEGLTKPSSVSELLGTVKIGRTERELLEDVLHILEKRNEGEKLDEIVRVLREMADESDDEKSLEEKINKILVLQPTIGGFGFNFNEAIKLYFKRKGKNK